MSAADDIIEVTVAELDGRGCGIALGPDGEDVSLPGVLPGESARARVEHRSGAGRIFARPVEITAAAPDRVDPGCPHFLTCGGCDLLHADLAHQHAFKRRQVAAALGRPVDAVEPVVASPRTHGYRALAKLVVRADGVLGSYRPRTHDVTDMQGCRVHAPEVEAVVDAIRAALKVHPVALRYVLVRGALSEGTTVVTFVARHASVDGLDALVIQLAARPDVARVVLNVNDREGDALLGDTDVVLHDGPAPREQIGSVTASLAAGAFSQVNPLAAARLYEVVVNEAAPDGRSVLDLYCGSGGIALALAAAGARRVLAVDVDPRAAAAAEASVVDNGMQGRVEVRAARAEDVTEVAAEIVILNPPRKGAAASVLEAVSALRPARLVYVSCNPKSLARDLEALEALGPMEVRRVVPVDLFPHTRHVETVVSVDLLALEG